MLMYERVKDGITDGVALRGALVATSRAIRLKVSNACCF